LVWYFIFDIILVVDAYCFHLFFDGEKD